MTTEHVDVLIIGAGLSGIGAGCHLSKKCPDKKYLILEARSCMGGTWDLFRYPGIRSDSDMFSLGYNFKPWTSAQFLADGPAILNYIKEAAADGAEPAAQIVEEAGLDLTDASNAIALRVLIEQLGTLGQHEKAADLVHRALIAQPDEAVFHELQGRTLHSSGQAGAARAGYERALELDAQSWRALAGLAALTAEDGRVADALSLYDRSIAAGPDDPAPAFAAVALVRDGDPAEAARRLEQLLGAHPRTTSAAYELAEILADRGELDRAEIFASRAAWFRFPEAEAMLARIEKLRSDAPVT